MHRVFVYGQEGGREQGAREYNQQRSVDLLTVRRFRERIEYLDRQITLAATGGLVTMLAQSGSRTLAGGAHFETPMQIARGDAAVLSEVFQRQFDLPLLSEFFREGPVLAYFEFALPATD